MGGRGSGSGRGGSSASIGTLKEREKSLNSQIDKLNKRLADYASKILRGICQADITMYREKNRHLNQKSVR